MFYFSFHNFTQKLNCLQGLNFRARRQDLHPKFWNSEPKEYHGREAPGQTILPFYGEFGFLKRWSTRMNALWILWYFGKSDWWISWIFYCETIVEIHGFPLQPSEKFHDIFLQPADKYQNIFMRSIDEFRNFYRDQSMNFTIFSPWQIDKINPPATDRRISWFFFFFSPQSTDKFCYFFYN